MEYIPGVTIREYTQQYGWTMESFLMTAIQISNALSHIHGHRIIHRDFNSSNILFDPSSQEISLIDLELAQYIPVNDMKSVPRGATVPLFADKSNQRLTGTLAYISPEQTGRTNQPVDWRTDLYSLGITLYEMITGVLPFSFEDEMELIHAHLAVMPTPPDEIGHSKIDQPIPEPISRIIMKLMAKDPNDRYQSAASVELDLTNCLTYWKEEYHIPVFELDKGGRFLHLSEKLYERDFAQSGLLSQLDHLRQGSFQLSFISGAAGTGKTSLVQSIKSSIIAEGGHLVSGKFDPIQQQMPYAAWIQAFSELVQELLTSDSYQLENWKNRILEAVGDNGKILSQIIPDLELILGPQTGESELKGKDATNRFHFVLLNFIDALSRADHSLTIFLDDFQYADSASIALLESLLTDNRNSYLWIIIAFRDDDIRSDFDLQEKLSPIKSQHKTVNEIELKNLSLNAVNSFIHETLQSDPESTLELSKVIYEKTQGNPFFLRQTISSIFDQGYLYHTDGGVSTWQWNLLAIRQLNITDNVVDYMAAKIQQLPDTTKTLLEWAACIGDKFELRILKGISEMSLDAISGALQPARDEGLIVTIDIEEEYYKFTHDRIRRAIYSLIPNELTPDLHRKIGDLMMEPYQSARLAEIPTDKVFSIVSQWNQGISKIQERTNRNKAAELNLLAGKKANFSGAYPTAMAHLKTGIDLLAQYGWQNTYRLNLQLHNEAAEAAFLSGDLELMDQFVEKILQQTVTVMDKVKAYEIKLQSYIAQQRLTAAVQLGLKILSQLGIELPDAPKEIQVWWQTFNLQRSLKRKSPEEFIQFPNMSDPKLLAAMQIMSNVLSIIQIIKPKLVPLLIYRQIQLTLKYGCSPFSGEALIGYGLILNLRQGKIDEGFEYGEAGMKLSEKFEDRRHKTRLYHTFYGLLWSYKKNISDAQPLLKEGYLLGLETGDFSSATFCIIQFVYNAFMLGEDLSDLIEELNIFYNALSQAKQEVALKYLSFLKELIQAFLTFQPEAWKIKEVKLEEQLVAEQIDASQESPGIINLSFLKLILAYHYENYEEGVKAARELEEYGFHSNNLEIDPNYSFYFCLVHLAAYPDLKMPEQQKVMKKVLEHQKYIRFRSDYAPQNYLHKHHLIEAERLRILGKEEDARPFYEKALELARNNDHLKDESLSWELAGKFYRVRGQQFLAEMHLQQAIKAYQRWNAMGIVEHLANRYPRYINKQLSWEQSANGSIKNSGSSSGESLTNLDLHSITKASQALSGEVVLSNLLNKMMQIVIENAGASRGVFLENRSDNIYFLAEGDVNKGVSVHISREEKANKLFPSHLINYCLRTSKVIVIDHPKNDSTFGKDPYIKLVQPASVLCFPIHHKNNLKAFIYLENLMIPGAFTKERMEILDILSSQIAISIENARLYENLDEKVKERTRQLNEKNQELGLTLSQLEEAHSQLKSAQSQLVQREKMASLGQLTNGMAHEINNPINFITGNIRPLKRNIDEVKELLEKVKKLPSASNLPEVVKEINSYREEIDADFLVEEIDMLVEGIKDGAQRTQSIVTGLKSFTRPDEETFKYVNIHQGIDSTLTLLSHELNPNIIVKKAFSDIPSVECIPGKLNQIFMNVLNNSIYAVKEQIEKSIEKEEAKAEHHIYIETKGEEDQVHIYIKDRGVGMPESVRQRVFDPFFTTKDVGEGTGLGMAIVYGIIEQHNGSISITSEEGRGTEVHIILPTLQPESLS